MNFLNKLSIKTRVIAAASISIASLLFSIFWFLHIQTNQKAEIEAYVELLSLKSKIEKFNTLISHLPNIADNDFKFYKYGENALVKHVQQLEDSIARQLSDLQHSPSIKAFGLLENINQTYALFDKYGLQVFHFIELLKERGNNDVGLVSQNIKNSNELFKLGQKLQVHPKLAAIFNRFLHYEKLYYFTNAPNYRDEVLWFMNDIRPQLEKHREKIAPIFSTDDEKLLDALTQNSIKNIEKLQSLENELSPTLKNGTWITINNLDKSISGMFLDTLSILEQQVETRETKRSATYNTLVFFLLLVNLAVWLDLTRHLRLSFNAVKDFFRRMSNYQNVSTNSNYTNQEVQELQKLSQQVVDRRKENIALLEGLIHDKNPQLDTNKVSDRVSEMFLTLRSKIDKIKQESAKSKDEERLNSWHIEGQTKIEKVFRTHDVKLSELSQELIKIVVDFLNVNQGALFMLNEEDNKLQLFAAYSLGKFKAVYQEFELGDGLVGSCALEQKPIYLTDVPDSYFKIHSGLGEALPTCVYLLPLIVDNRLYGVLEVASFDELESRIRSFLDAVSVNIASGFARIKTSYESEILSQKAKKRSHEMAKREEKLNLKLEDKETKITALSTQIDALENKLLYSKNQLHRSKANEELMHMEVLKYQQLVKDLKTKNEQLETQKKQQENNTETNEQ